MLNFSLSHLWLVFLNGSVLQVVLVHAGSTSLIAHIRVGRMQAALEAKSTVQPAVGRLYWFVSLSTSLHDYGNKYITRIMWPTKVTKNYFHKPRGNKSSWTEQELSSQLLDISARHHVSQVTLDICSTKDITRTHSYSWTRPLGHDLLRHLMPFF